MRLIRECVLPHWRIVSISVGAMLVSAATAGAMPFLLQRVGDDVFVAKNATLSSCCRLLIVAAVVVRAARTGSRRLPKARSAPRSSRTSAIRMFDTIAAADLAWIQGIHSGRFVSAFVSDSATVDRAATRVLIGLFKNGAELVFLIGAMFYMDWRLSLVVLIGAPLAILNLGRQRKRIGTAAGRALREAGDLNSMLTQTLQSMRVVKAYGQEANEARAPAPDRAQHAQILHEGHPHARGRRPVLGDARSASASPRACSTAAGRASTATSRSASSWAS